MPPQPLTPKKVVGGIVAGAAASCIVAPLITIIDVAVVAASAGKTSLLQALVEGIKSWLSSPSVQLKSFAVQLVWMVYFLTYASANTVKAVCDATGASATLPNLIIVTGTNMASSMYKDAAIAKAEKRKVKDQGKGADEKERGFPMLSYLLFVFRDVLTVGSGFVLPARVSAKLMASGMSAASAGLVSQLLCPAAVQYVTLPFHYLALDVFNNPVAELIERLRRLAENYPRLTSIRVLRGLASFGLGGIGNTRFLALMDS
jgi:hypothetical protein